MSKRLPKVCRGVSKVLALWLIVLSLPVSAYGISQVSAKTGSGRGTVTPGSSIIPNGASQDFIISSSGGTIGYVTLDGGIVTVFKTGGIGKTMAIVTIRENGKKRTLIVYFTKSGTDMKSEDP